MADLEDRGRKPEEKLGEGVASEVGCRAAKRRSSGLRLLSVVGTLVLTAICSAGTPVAARGRDATLPGEDLPGDIYTNGPNSVPLGNDSTFHQVAQVSVPAGNYVVHVSMNVVNSSFGLTATLRCTLAQSPTVFPTFVPPIGSDFLVGVTLSFTDIASLSSAGTIAVLCKNDVPATDSVTVILDVRLTAIRGGTLHQQ